jgi:hypothetical protein
MDLRVQMKSDGHVELVDPRHDEVVRVGHLVVVAPPADGGSWDMRLRFVPSRDDPFWTRDTNAAVFRG